MEVCADDTNTTLQNRLSAPVGPTVNARGNYTFRQIEAFSAALEQNIASDAETNPITIARTKYDNFDEGQQNINAFLNGARLTSYPELQSRFEKGPISSLEYADFIKDYTLTPTGCINKARYNPTDLLSNINNYYAGSFSQSSMGGLCAQMPAFFAKIDAFFTLIGIAEGVINDALEFLGKIRDLDDIIRQAIQKATVTALINKLKEKLIEAFTKAFEDVFSAITNFSIEDVIGDVSTFINEEIVKKIMIKKERMCLFFNDENKKTIEEKINSLIDYAVGMFENPNIEELQYLISRFCAFVFNIEALMNDIKGPLDNFANKYSNIANRLKIISDINTSSAIRNGAVRMSDETMKEEIEKQEAKFTPENGKAITPTGTECKNVKRITIKEYSTLPSCKKVKDGTDPKLGISGDWVDDKDCGLEGYVNIDLDVKVYLVRLSDDLGQKLVITNGWRSQQYNEAIGCAAESPFTSGKVVTIENLGIDEDEFADKATTAGFKFIKRIGVEYMLDIRRRPQ